MNEKGLIRVETVKTAFTEDEARVVLWAWCDKNSFDSAQILQLTRWDYTEPPFYSAHVRMWRGGLWPEEVFVHIKKSGEVIKFKAEE